MSVLNEETANLKIRERKIRRFDGFGLNFESESRNQSDTNTNLKSESKILKVL